MKLELTHIVRKTYKQAYKNHNNIIKHLFQTKQNLESIENA